jgi:hypothetical protein
MKRFLVLLALLLTTQAAAQTPTGTIEGSVVDEKTHDPMLLVTVVINSSSGGAWSEFTDRDGAFAVPELPPGRYLVTFIYGKLRVRRGPVEVIAGGRTTVDATLDGRKAAEIVTLQKPCSPIDLADDLGPGPTTRCERQDEGARLLQERLPRAPYVYDETDWRIERVVLRHDDLSNLPWR